MNKFIKTLGIIGVSALILVGCATTANLDVAGAYGGDTFLYNTDQTIVQTYNIIDQFLIWETANKDYVKANLPQVYNGANSIRTNAPLVLTLISIDRSLYVSLKSSTNTTAFAQASNNLQNAAVSFGNQITNVSYVTNALVTPPSPSSTVTTISSVLTHTNVP